MTAAGRDPRLPRCPRGEETDRPGRLRVGGRDVEYEVTWMGREVGSPTLRAVIAVIAVALGVVVAGLGIVLAGILIALSVPLHLVLRALGRAGFLTVEGRSLTYEVGRHGFRRRS
ncbi:MAG TPA: hypothetical protein VHA80_05515 [Solirubrobacterales bacterium]|nr:hypothetical protein [Solirubrobacterales bacterium]